MEGETNYAADMGLDFVLGDAAVFVEELPCLGELGAVGERVLVAEVAAGLGGGWHFVCFGSAVWYERGGLARQYRLYMPKNLTRLFISSR